MIEKVKSIAVSIYIALALIGWIVALFAWNDPPLGFEIISNTAAWVALVWLAAVIAGFVLQGLDKLASR